MKRKSTYIEKLKGLYEKRNKNTTGLEFYTVPILRELIKEEETFWVCRSCGGQLTRLKWSKEKDLVTCDNSDCEAYRNPVGTIIKEVPADIKEALSKFQKEVLS